MGAYIIGLDLLPYCSCSSAFAAIHANLPCVYIQFFLVKKKAHKHDTTPRSTSLMEYQKLVLTALMGNAFLHNLARRFVDLLTNLPVLKSQPLTFHPMLARISWARRAISWVVYLRRDCDEQCKK